MALNAVLWESTQHRLRYRIEDNGAETEAPSTLQIGNSGGASPDLRTDAHEGTPMHDLVSTQVADDNAAAQLLEGYGLTDDPNESTPRAHIEITPYANPTGAGAIWGARALEGTPYGSADYAIIHIEGPNVFQAYCWVDIIFEHSATR